jgi:sec-independent protein translocase protein TatA
MMGLDNPIHIAFLLIVLLLVFGAKRLPELGHSLGTGLRGFKEAIGGDSAHVSLNVAEREQPTPERAPTTPEQAPTAHPSAAPLTSVKDNRGA